MQKSNFKDKEEFDNKRDDKPIIFSQHSLEKIEKRGTNESEIRNTIKYGEKIPAKKDRVAYRKNFSFKNKWKGKHYEIKQVMPIVKEESDKIIIITVYVFFIGGGDKE